jgi:hypothetical protein
MAQAQLTSAQPLRESPDEHQAMILDSPNVDATLFEARTGWSIKPEGACKGGVCVPLDGLDRTQGTLPVEPLAERLGMPIVADATSGKWALGPDTAVNGRALCTAIAPDLVLPDVDGALCRIADLRPQKVVLVAWASW